MTPTTPNEREGKQPHRCNKDCNIITIKEGDSDPVTVAPGDCLRVESSKLRTSNEREDWEKEFDKIFVYENVWQGEDEYTKNVPIGNIKDFIRSLLTRTRQEEREKVVEYIKANSALTDNPIESNSQLIDCSYYQIYAGALEQARNLT